MRSDSWFKIFAVLLGLALPAQHLLAEEGNSPPASASAQTTAQAAPTAEEVEALRREVEDLRRQIQALRDQLRAGLPPEAGAGPAAPGAPAPEAPSPVPT